MRRKCVILAAVCLAMMMTACSPKASESTSQETTQAVTEEAGETKEEESKEETAETTKAEETAKAEKVVVTGLVDAVEKTVVTISGQDGEEYQIDLKDAETKSEGQEISEGDELQIVFLDGGDSQVKKAESYQIISSAAMRENMDPVIAGVITQSDDDSVTIELEDQEDGKSYTFSTKIAQIVTGEKGLGAGEYVEITYLGTLNQGVALRVITEEGSGDAEATYNALKGTLVSISDDSVTIEAADGTQFTLALGDSIIASEYSAGEEVEITYDGSLTNQNAVAGGIE